MNLNIDWDQRCPKCGDDQLKKITRQRPMGIYWLVILECGHRVSIPQDDLKKRGWLKKVAPKRVVA